ncbi:hypothetical protein Tco_0372144, partial [Tanacetum coccineum]
MLRLELHIASVLVVEKPTLSFLSQIYFLFFWVNSVKDFAIFEKYLIITGKSYEDAIVIPEITANNFEIKHGLLNLVQNKQFFGNDKEDPHAHIRYFNKITSTMKILEAPVVPEAPDAPDGGRGGGGGEGGDPGRVFGESCLLFFLVSS